MPGETYYAIAKIESDTDKIVPFWIGFETPHRANRVYNGIPKEGSWDSSGGEIWINGKKLPAPNWENPGWKPSKTKGWGSKEDQEIPWRIEELYWTRPPVAISLSKGTNTVLIKIPGTTDYQNWMFTFCSAFI